MSMSVCGFIILVAEEGKRGEEESCATVGRWSCYIVCVLERREEKQRERDREGKQRERDRERVFRATC